MEYLRSPKNGKSSIRECSSSRWNHVFYGKIVMSLSDNIVETGNFLGPHCSSNSQPFPSSYPQPILGVPRGLVRPRNHFAASYSSNHFLVCSFIWSMTTLVLNRSLLHVRQVEVMEAFATEWLQTGPPEITNRSPSPFGLPLEYLDDWELEEELQTREIKVPLGSTPGILVDGKTRLVVELNNYIPWQKRNEVKAAESRMFSSFLF
jgi:hypothetical protein